VVGNDAVLLQLPVDAPVKLDPFAQAGQVEVKRQKTWL